MVQQSHQFKVPRQREILNTKLQSYRHLGIHFYSIYLHMALKSEVQTMTACFQGYSTLTLRNTMIQCVKIISLGAFLSLSICIATRYKEPTLL
jgi:hypothetical protein